MAHPSEMSIKQLQEEVDQWISRFAEGYWHPLSMMARLSEEVGELAREVNDRYGQKPKKPEEEEGDIAMEIGDILFVIAAFANSLDIDLQESFTQVMDKYKRRDSKRWTPKTRA